MELTKAELKIIERCRRNLRWKRTAIWVLAIGAVLHGAIFAWLCLAVLRVFKVHPEAYTNLIRIILEAQFADGVDYLLVFNSLNFLPIFVFTITSAVGVLAFIPRRAKTERLLMKLWECAERGGAGPS